MLPGANDVTLYYGESNFFFFFHSASLRAKTFTSLSIRQSTLLLGSHTINYFYFFLRKIPRLVVHLVLSLSPVLFEKKIKFSKNGSAKEAPGKVKNERRPASTGGDILGRAMWSSISFLSLPFVRYLVHLGFPRFFINFIKKTFQLHLQCKPQRPLVSVSVTGPVRKRFLQKKTKKKQRKIPLSTIAKLSADRYRLSLFFGNNFFSR